MPGIGIFLSFRYSLNMFFTTKKRHICVFCPVWTKKMQQVAKPAFWPAVRMRRKFGAKRKFSADGRMYFARLRIQSNRVKQFKGANLRKNDLSKQVVFSW